MSVPAARMEPLAPAAITALVVDDDEFVRGMVARQLQSLGAGRVTTAGDGDSAREALKQQRVDVVVCDLMMPGVDGVQLIREIAEAQPGTAVIIMSSADAKLLRTAEHLAQRRDVRVIGTLSKPVRVAALKGLIEQMQESAGQAPSERRRGPRQEEINDATVRDALAAREMDIVVQPQICLSSGLLVANEALVRWHSPTLGLVTPDRFLKVIERCGLINELTDLVLQRAVSVCGDWHRQGLETRIAVNFAPETLSQDGLPERIAALAHEHGIPASRIVVEMTEHRLMNELEDPLEVLTRLRLRGIELAIDDFGTGYSSLDRLQQIPFNELKIDRSFVIAAERNEDARRIIESSVRLAHDLGMRTVAEGVETAATLELIRALGCDIVQGYYYARPMPADQLIAWSCQHAAATGCHEPALCPLAHQCKFSGRLY